MQLLYKLSKRPKAQVLILVPHWRDILDYSSLLESVDTNALGLPQKFTVSEFLATPTWGSERHTQNHDHRFHRLKTLTSLNFASHNLTVATPSALLQKTLSPESFKAQCFAISKGDKISFETLEKRLLELEYERADTVTERGSFSVKGGIVEIFSTGEKNPCRFEFYGDEIETLFFFNPQTQRNLKETLVCQVAPRYEVITTKVRDESVIQELYEDLLAKNFKPLECSRISSSLREGYESDFPAHFAPYFRDQEILGLDYFTKDEVFILSLGTKERITSTVDNFFEEVESQIRLDIVDSIPHLDRAEHYTNPQELSKLWTNPHVVTATSGENEALTLSPEQFGMSFKSSAAVLKEIEENQRASSDSKTLLCIRNLDQQEIVKALLEVRGLSSKTLNFFDAFEKSRQGHEIFIVPLPISGHCRFFDRSFDYIDASQFIKKDPSLRDKQRDQLRRVKDTFNSFKDIKIGSLVVHVEHGIGRYFGIENLKVGNVDSDFIRLEYEGGDKLYVPVDQIFMLQRYGEEDTEIHSARVDKLRGTGWVARKNKVKKAVRDIAAKLLEVGAKRALTAGVQLDPPDEQYREFERNFPYTETDDQLRVISEVNEDLSSPKAMDRLVCGDVGFGKTEIAIRAAYRAYLCGYQTLFLCPTTVLCMQHYDNLKKRYEKYGVRVGQLSRYVGTEETKKTLADLASGGIDVVVGTHRLLSKDVVIRKLGFLIVDEEQRFGVGHKEKIKEISFGVNILTLTATPIPRTLHMSLLGLKDISILATPPRNRLPVKTYVSEFDEELLKSAIAKEVSRSGQTFVLHNKVEDIEQFANYLKNLVPNTRIQIAHGQMPEGQLEKVILQFIRQEFSVLVCTTIIESGIDMPHVNTLVVDSADRFGLGQLYQIRGRVGRSDRQAYAYFFTPSKSKLSEDAKDRLQVLQAHQALGSGFQVAHHDLDIRGAGTLLGAEQSGRIADVGSELYTSMLEEAIRELEDKDFKARTESEVKFKVAAQIPAEFIESESIRLDLYRRIFKADDSHELMKTQAEARERFGELPVVFDNLFLSARLKLNLQVLYIKSIQHFRDDVFSLDLTGCPSNSGVFQTKVLAYIKLRKDHFALQGQAKILIRLKVEWSPSDPAIQKASLEELNLRLEELLQAAETF